MRTVSTLCASGAGIGVSAIGLSLVNDPNQPYSSTRPSSRDMSLTATTVFTFTANSHSSPTYRLATPSSHRFPTTQSFSSPITNAANEPRFQRSVSENAALTLRSPTPRARSSRSRVSLPSSANEAGGRRRSFTDLEDSISHDTRLPTRRTWLRRLSNSLSSRESSRAPSSRPTSAAISQYNGSTTLSHVPSTTPILPSNPPSTPLPPNKLVKRSTSVRSFSNQSSSTSKLPRPTFKRPATSHQRSSISQRPSEDLVQLDRVLNGQSSAASRDAPWRQYFVPRISADAVLLGRKRASSIPNPIKRVFPDRRYRPMLVSASQPIARMMVEVDDGFSSADGSLVDLGTYDHRVVSSPIPNTSTEQQPPARRSFSIGDVLSTGPQPLWKSSSNRGRTIRRSRRRVSSASNSEMGSVLSLANTTDSERPNKRREIVRGDTPQGQDASAIDDEIWNAGDLPPTSHPFTRAKDGRLSSPMPQQSAQSGRESAATSDMTDGEIRSFSDSNTDYQSDMLFDSIPTRTTRSSSGRRGPPIDTIFNETPPNFSSGRSTKLADYLNQDNFPISDKPHRYSTIEEEESISTPVRSLRDGSITSSPTARGTTRSIFSSSPPMLRDLQDAGAINWDAFDEVADTPETPTMSSVETKRLPLRFAPALKQSDTAVHLSTPLRNGGPSIFDWSEVQPSPSQNHSPPRPRTVHGKKDSDNRTSRTATRRTPSAMHSRSHSVPVVPDGEGKRNAGHNKFGTWGVGSKAVTEDWNEDFDFEDEQAQADEQRTDSAADKRIDSGHEMLVPVAIREQQQNVMANIGLLREWGLLIEELKELRMRAVALDMLNGPFAQAWSEVDAMIELADQETEEQTLEPRRSPPSSPGFDYSAFEEILPDPPQAPGLSRLPEPLMPPPVLPAMQNVTSAPNRPRKDSEAVARSVIEALRQKRSVSDPAALEPVPSAKKVPFDTATLRHIVPYVSNLRAKIKEALRETEGLYKSPVRTRDTAAGARRDGSPATRNLMARNDDIDLSGFDSD